MEVQQLRQQIVQVEQQLRAVMAPTYLPHDREQAARDQQVGRRSFVSSFVITAADLVEMAGLSNLYIIGSGGGGGFSCALLKSSAT